MMKKNLKCAVAAGAAAMLAAGLFFSGAGEPVYGENEIKKTEEKLTETIEENIRLSDSADTDKEETVYVIADAQGNAEKKIVSTWLKNRDKADRIEDVANLTEIENVKGEEEFSEGENGKITWKAGGEDIYYQGISGEELPVDVKVTYLLDGNEISPEELAGKSGKVTIRIDYVNNTKEEVTVNGKKQTLKTPFAMITGMVLPVERFSGVEVKNGKLISDGDNQIVAGIGFPGLNENLQLSSLSGEADIEFPEFVEVTADVQEFSLMMTLTMGTADVFGMIDIDTEAGTEEMAGGIDKLTGALSRLSDGTGQLAAGLEELKTGMNAFAEQTKPFAEGLKTYTSYVDQFSSGAGQIAAKTGKLEEEVPKLTAGIEELNAGMSLLRQNIADDKKNTTLLKGAIQVNGGVKNLQTAMNHMYSELGTNITTYEKNVAALKKGIGDAKNTLATAAAGVKQYKDGIATLKAAAEGCASAGDTTGALGYYKQLAATYAELTGVYDQMVAGYEALLGYEEQLGQCEGAILALSQIKGEMDKNNLTQNLKALKDGTQSMEDGIRKLAESVDKQLAPGVEQLAAKTKDLPQGITELNTYIAKLSSGLAQVSEKSEELNQGVTKIADAQKRLQDGIGTLEDGGNTLNTSVGELENKIVAMLSELTQGDVDALLERAEATGELARKYTSFSGLAGGKKGTVKFIYRTSEIKEKD